VDSSSNGGEVLEEAIRLYIGLNETKWNHHPIVTGGYCCVSPVYGKTERTKKKNNVFVPAHNAVIQDSGAFCDGPGQRLSFQEALQRQKDHAAQYDYANKIEYRASYDLLIDEKWEGGVRYKKRWTVDDAERAVKETIDAARYISKEDRLSHVLSAQGVDSSQYLECVLEVVPLMKDRDALGLGGWCITGLNKRKMLPEFLDTVKTVIPRVAESVTRIHIWGVMLAEALGPLLWMCDQYDIKLSTDSSGPSWRPAFGEWGYAEWRDKGYERPPVETRGLHRIWHVAETRLWLNNFRSTQWYKEP